MSHHHIFLDLLLFALRLFRLFIIRVLKVDFDLNTDKAGFFYIFLHLFLHLLHHAIGPLTYRKIEWCIDVVD